MEIRLSLKYIKDQRKFTKMFYCGYLMGNGWDFS